MSDLLIKGMKMPKGCLFCKIKKRNGKKMICPFCDEEWDIRDPMSADHRLENCPLVEVPPHGRLIDADALDKMLKFIGEAEAQIYGRNSWGFVNKCRQALCDAPTIVPAEEETCTKN